MIRTLSAHGALTWATRARAWMGRAFAALAVAACASSPAFDLGTPPRGVDVDSRLQHYDVTAASLQEIRRAIQQRGPRLGNRTWGAATTWNYSWSYQYERHGVACELRRVVVRVRTSVTLPRWTPTAEPDSALSAWWQQYSTGLTQHEHGHAIRAVDFAGEMARALEGMIASSCDALGRQARAEFERRLEAANARQREYDRSTMHGATQIQQVRQLNEP